MVLIPMLLPLNMNCGYYGIKQIYDFSYIIIKTYYYFHVFNYYYFYLECFM